MISSREYEILRHASNNDGRFVTEEPAVLDMAQRGLMTDFGPWELAGGAHALRITRAGRDALNEYGAAQPKPKVKKRRVSRTYERWERYQEAFGCIGFCEFWKLEKKGLI